MERELTYDYIVKACAAQLKRVFSNSRVYWEKQPQDFKRPCFKITQILVSQNKEFGKRYTRTYRIRITWFPLLNTNNLISECTDVGNALLSAFRMLTLPWKSVWGRDAEFEIVDDTLHFTVDFSIFAFWVEDPLPKMDTLDITENIKQ